MPRVLLAIFFSFGVHLMLALALGYALTQAPADSETTAAELDLSSVTLSLSDREAEAPPVQQLPSVAAPPLVASPRPVPPPPPPPAGPAPFLDVPPEAADISLPEPDAEEKPAFDPVPHEEPPPEKKEEERTEDPPPEEPVAEEPPPEEVRPPEEEKRPAESASSAAAPVPAPQQAQVDVPPKPRQTIKPKYPDGARQRGEEGDVLLELDVTDRGTVSAVRIVRTSGYAALDAAAQQAAKKARFTPAKANGQSVPTTARLTLSFRLKK